MGWSQDMNKHERTRAPAAIRTFLLRCRLQGGKHTILLIAVAIIVRVDATMHLRFALLARLPG